MIHLISAENIEHARARAREHGILIEPWVYIPYCENTRSEKLRGIRVNEDQLIGYFSEDERVMLTRGHHRTQPVT